MVGYCGQLSHQEIYRGRDLAVAAKGQTCLARGQSPKLGILLIDLPRLSTLETSDPHRRLQYQRGLVPRRDRGYRQRTARTLRRVR